MRFNREEVEGVLSSAGIDKITLIDNPSSCNDFGYVNTRNNSSNVFIKSDSNLNNLYSGSKLRNLEYIIPYLLKHRIKRVSVYGSIQSNFSYMLALYGKRFGFDVKCVLTDLSNLSSKERDLYLQSIRLQGAEINEVGMVRFLLSRAISRLQDGYVPTGGTSTVGCLGPLMSAFELGNDIDRGRIPVPDTIILPIGSGGMTAGLSVGLRLAGIRSRIKCVNIGSHITRRNVNILVSQVSKPLVQLLGGRRNKELPNFEIVSGFSYGKYGNFSLENLSLVKELYHLEKLQLDSIYTVKAFRYLLDYSKHEGRSENILFWNTCSGQKRFGVEFI